MLPIEVPLSDVAVLSLVICIELSATITATGMLFNVSVGLEDTGSFKGLFSWIDCFETLVTFDISKRSVEDVIFSSTGLVSSGNEGSCGNVYSSGTCKHKNLNSFVLQINPRRMIINTQRTNSLCHAILVHWAILFAYHFPWHEYGAAY